MSKSYLYDLIWYVAQCETIEPLVALEDVGQNSSVQLVGNLSKKSFWFWREKKGWNLFHTTKLTPPVYLTLQTSRSPLTSQGMSVWQLWDSVLSVCSEFRMKELRSMGDEVFCICLALGCCK